MASFLDRLRSKTGKEEVPKGVLSADAAPRETPREESDTAEPKGRGRPKGSKNRSVDVGGKSQEKKNGNGFTLYIDCIPTKDTENSGLEPTLFEDWITPIVLSMNEIVLKEKNLPHYQLLPYAEEKAMFSIAVNESAERLPPMMVLNSGTPGAKDALGVLIPHASKVVRALRG